MPNPERPSADLNGQQIAELLMWARLAKLPSETPSPEAVQFVATSLWSFKHTRPDAAELVLGRRADAKNETPNPLLALAYSTDDAHTAYDLLLQVRAAEKPQVTE